MQMIPVFTTLLGAVAIGQGAISNESPITIGFMLIVIGGVLWIAVNMTSQRKDIDNLRRDLNKMDIKLDKLDTKYEESLK